MADNPVIAAQPPAGEMSEDDALLHEVAAREYEHGWVTDT